MSCVQRAQSDSALDDSSICFENIAKFRKFLNSINYDGPIAASTDNMKLEKNYVILQTNNAINKYVRIYVLQVPIPKVPLFVLEIIPNNSENVNDVHEIHKQVLELTAHFKIHILSIGADDINSYCPIIPNIGPIVCVSDLKHAKKSRRNSIFSGARMLTFGNSFLGFGYVLELSKSLNSVLYHVDVLNVDKQDDGAA
ncbi:hypothetical protein RclHR1_16920005 [Rhizophagus clarus]|uniref:Uncharacterized protein n=1 Tax=Rhizophagus clarus TaxID=94130 RepID=A0A2Z6QK59_9GLOM|nr:hypothetical protein RclHR1_16920005 [Rhizophagus clarus]